MYVFTVISLFLWEVIQLFFSSLYIFSYNSFIFLQYSCIYIYFLISFNIVSLYYNQWI